MGTILERVYAELSTVLLKHPELKGRLADRTRNASREMVRRFDAHGQWKEREQDRHRHSISPNPLVIQACGTIRPLPEPPQSYVIREIRNRIFNDDDQALVLTAIYNSAVDEGLKIDPWAGIEKDAVDENAWLHFESESYDSAGDGFGLDPCGVVSKDSPLRPGDEPTLLHFVSNLTNVPSLSPLTAPLLDVPGETDADSCRLVVSPDPRSAKKRRNRGPDASSDELVKRILVKHHLNHDGTINEIPLSTRKIEQLTDNAISDTTAGNVLNRLFGCNQKYRDACKSGIIGTQVKVFDEGVRALGTIDTSMLAETLDENGKPIRDGRRSKPVGDDR